MNPEAAGLYLDLLKKCLTRSAFPDEFRPLFRPGSGNNPIARAAHSTLGPWFSALGIAPYRHVPDESMKRAEGRGWPASAETMIGMKRLNQLEEAIVTVIREDIAGDLIETGCWRGGATIFMRAALKAYGDDTRTVWVADSFEGLPKPDGRFPQDKGDQHWKFNGALGISLEEVRANFARYDLLDDRVRFLKGWFKDTLPTAPIERLAVIRLDGDMYSSTMDALANLYERLSPGGYAIVDDYGAVPACKQAIHDYRARHGIDEPIQAIDWSGIFWRKRI